MKGSLQKIFSKASWECVARGGFLCLQGPDKRSETVRNLFFNLRLLLILTISTGGTPYESDKT